MMQHKVNIKIDYLISQLEQMKISPKEECLEKLYDISDDLEKIQEEVNEFKKWVEAGKLFIGGK